ncbi:MAG: NADH-quinone oxidoreductase subunit N, partial [Chitinophagaceae bacterium]
MNTELILFLQELLVTLLIFLLLLLRLGKPVSAAVYLNITLLFLAATGIRLVWIGYRGVLFGGLFATVPMMVIQKTILLFAAFLLVLLNYESLKKHPHLPELLMLLLSSLLGMLLLISSGTMLMLYLSLELATLPLSALVSFDLGKKSSSEVAMKMVFSSAFASGILLFGISLFYGAYGTLRFAEIPYAIKGSSLEVMAFLFMIAGFAFKLSAVPFHFWTADVYEGAPTPVTAFLSVVSKAAVAFVFLSFLYRVFQALGQTTQTVLTLLALLSLVVGNLFALRQQNLKRFLAFSSITQMGFVMVAISSGSTLSSPAVIYFMLIYLFSNLAAFGVVELVSLKTGRETIAEFA